MNAINLAGKHLLVTRPIGQGDELLRQLRNTGAHVTHYPVLNIAPLAPADQRRRQHCKQQILALDLFQQVIFISSNAVQFGMDWIEDYWPQPPVTARWQAIGRATADAMAARGLSVDSEGESALAMNSEALLARPAMQDISGQKILIVRGVGGREYLAEQLRQRGATVEYIECYQRQLPEAGAVPLTSLLARQPMDVICLNSGESLDNFCQLLASGLASALDTAVLVPSERVAAAAKERGFNCVITATNAGVSASIEALEQYFSQRI